MISHNVQKLKLIIACIGFFLVADLGLISQYDGIFYVAVLALTMGSLTPYLMLLVVCIQDAPGFVVKSDYIAFAFLSLILWIRIIWGDRKIISFLSSDLLKLGGAAILLIIYGVINSAFFGYTQSELYPYWLVGLFMAMVVIAGLGATISILNQEDGLTMLKITSVLNIAHILLTILLQVFLGFDSIRSQIGVDYIRGNFEAFEPGVLGTLRFSGTFLTPNAAAIAVFFLFLYIIVSSERSSISYLLIGSYGLLGLFLSLTTISRATTVIFFLTLLYLIWQKSKKIFYYGLLSSILIIIFLATSLEGQFIWTHITEYLRWKGASNIGVREKIWEVVIENTSWDQWLLGMGLSYWPEFFADNLMVWRNVTVKDPHCYLLSVPGMFGIFGIIFYIFIAIILYRETYNDQLNKRVIAVFLLITIYIRDLVAVPLLLNNTPISVMIWISIALLYSKNYHLQKYPNKYALYNKSVVFSKT